jgi:flagellar biosynthetic protein FliR
MPAHPFDLMLMVLAELILGLMLSLVVRFTFAGIQSGGQILAFQMGFSMTTVVDPMQGSQETIVAHFLYTVALLTFLVLNGHLYILKAFMDSFALIPPGGLLLSPPLAGEIITMSAQVFILAVRVAAPVLAALLLIDLALALVARANPQMNLLIIGFPLKIAIGMFFLGMLFMLMAEHIQEFIIKSGPLILNLLRAASPFNS